MKNVKWHKKRHDFFYKLISRFIAGLYLKVAYRCKVEKFDNSRPYLILFNHQTPFDQHIAVASMKKMFYFVGTEDLFTMGAVSKFIKYAAAPVAFKKSMADARAVMNCLKIVREGYSVSIAPEGNRTFTGETVNIKPSIAKLIKLLKIPVAIYSIRGGYPVIPRYADKPRRCGIPVTGRVSRVIEYDEYKDMSDDDLYQLIKDELYVDESELPVNCKSRRRAEFMERAVYLCPVCNSVGTLTSRKNTISCSFCGSVAEVGHDLQFRKPFPVHNLKEWTKLQTDWINNYDVTSGKDKPITVERVRLRKLLDKEMKKEVVKKNAEARLYSDRIEVDELVFPFDDIEAVTACGRCRLDFYVAKDTYQIDGPNNLCALKYANFFYHYKNVKEDKDGFLGI